MRCCRTGRALALVGIVALAGCGEQPPTTLVGVPDGPYRLSLALEPPAPLPGSATQLTFTIAHGPTRTPVRDLQIVHERALHTFIVARDFSSFAHLHHEDFATRTTTDIAHGRYTFPYRFPQAGAYRIVSEFVHRDRSWSKRFDVQVGAVEQREVPAADFSREREVGAYRAKLSVSPATPVAGHDAELVIELSRAGRPVTDLALWLGSEAHVAIWRNDGEHFGHTHSDTPAMARMRAAMQGHRMDAAHSAAMMLEMMRAPAQRVYPGPRVPVRHAFPTAGTWRVFFQLAPGGEPLALPFALEVVADDGRVDTRLHSIVPTTDAGH